MKKTFFFWKYFLKHGRMATECLAQSSQKKALSTERHYITRNVFFFFPVLSLLRHEWNWNLFRSFFVSSSADTRNVFFSGRDEKRVASKARCRSFSEKGAAKIGCTRISPRMEGNLYKIWIWNGFWIREFFLSWI